MELCRHPNAVHLVAPRNPLGGHAVRLVHCAPDHVRGSERRARRQIVPPAEFAGLPRIGRRVAHDGTGMPLRVWELGHARLQHRKQRFRQAIQKALVRLLGKLAHAKARQPCGEALRE
eukprot:2493167-Prymnesium_polylepis.1